MKRITDLQSGNTAPLPLLERPVIVFPRQHWKTIRPVEQRVMREVYRTQRRSRRSIEEWCGIALVAVVAVTLLVTGIRWVLAASL